MKRNFGWHTVVLAFVVTSVIFLLGFGSAVVYNELKVESIESDYTSLSEELESLSLEEMYIARALPEKKCELVGLQLQRLSNSLHATGRKLMAYHASKELASKFSELKKKYALLEVRTWMLSMENREQCHADIVDVFYFYALNNPESDQGYTIDFYKERIGQRLLVFSTDNQNPLPVLELIKSDKKVESMPTLIINGENKGYLSSEEFKQTICALYKEKPDVCNA